MHARFQSLRRRLVLAVAGQCVLLVGVCTLSDSLGAGAAALTAAAALASALLVGWVLVGMKAALACTVAQAAAAARCDAELHEAAASLRRAVALAGSQGALRHRM